MKMLNFNEAPKHITTTSAAATNAAEEKPLIDEKSCSNASTAATSYHAVSK